MEPTGLTLRLIRAALVAAIFVTLGAALGFCSEPNGERSSSFSSSLKHSRASGRPIMLVFTGGDWCSWCRRLDSEVFETPEFSRWSKKFLKMELNFPAPGESPTKISLQNDEILRRFQRHVEVYPTVLFVDAQGQVLAKTGYVIGGVQNWIANAELLLAAKQAHP